MQRVVLFGAAGSGKSRLAHALAARTGLPVHERDALGDLGSAEYLSAMAALAQGETWILDGPPFFAEQVVYPRADTIIALDYSKWVVLLRVLRRTLRVELGRPVGAHKRQGLRRAVRDPEHPVRWAWTSHGQRHERIVEMAADEEVRPKLIVLARPADAARFLDAIDGSSER